VTAVLAHANAWRDADPDRRFISDLRGLARARPAAITPRWPMRPGHCWPPSSGTRWPTLLQPPR